MYFGDTLRLFLIKKNLKIKNLSELTGLSDSALTNILKNRRGIKKESFLKIINALSLSEKEQFELKKAYSLDKMDSDIAKYFLELEEENKKQKIIIEAINFLKK